MCLFIYKQLRLLFPKRISDIKTLILISGHVTLPRKNPFTIYLSSPKHLVHVKRVFPTRKDILSCILFANLSK